MKASDVMLGTLMIKRAKVLAAGLCSIANSILAIR
jgi:hypothetical protein